MKHILKLFVSPEIFLSRHVLSRHVLFRHVLSRHVLFRHVLSRHVLFRHVLFRHVLSRHVLFRHQRFLISPRIFFTGFFSIISIAVILLPIAAKPKSAYLSFLIAAATAFRSY